MSNRFLPPERSPFPAKLFSASLSLGDGVLLDTTLRTTLGRGDAKSPVGAWMDTVDGMFRDHEVIMPCAKFTSWPGLSLLVAAIAGGCIARMHEESRPSSREWADPDREEVSVDNNETRRMIHSIWQKSVGLAIPVIAFATWRRRCAAVVCAHQVQADEWW